MVGAIFGDGVVFVMSLISLWGGTWYFLSMTAAAVISDVGNVSKGGMHNLGLKGDRLDDRGGLSFLFGEVLSICS